MQSRRRKGSRVIGLGVWWLALAATASAQTIIYVDVGAEPNGTGTTWEDAYDDLQDALGDDQIPSTCSESVPCEIWVAEGTYLPDQGLDETVSFVLDEVDVKLYGGFVGNETSLDERDWGNNVTILDGDLLGNDPDYVSDPFENYDENSEAVVRVDLATDVWAYLDGFTIRGGNAMGWQLADSGGGIRFLGGGAEVRNCVIKENRAEYGGGGTFAYARLDARFINCAFTDNFAEHGGAIAAKGWAGLELINCQIIRNEAHGEGGGIFIQCHQGTKAIPVEVRTINTLIADNVAGGDYGGGMAILGNEYLTVDILDSTIAYNTLARGFGGGLRVYFDGGSPYVNVTNTIIWGNEALGGSGNRGNEVYSAIAARRVTFNYCDVRDRGLVDDTDIDGNGNWIFAPENLNQDPLYVDTGQADYRLSGSSQCIDAGDNAAVPADEYDVDGDGNYGEDTPDLDLLPRIVDGDADLTKTVDLGAYEFQLCPAGATIDSADPADGTVDSRRHHGVFEDPTARHGIGEAGEEIVITLKAGNDLVSGVPEECFVLCETPEDLNEEEVGPNAISSVEDNQDGTYEITLARGITPLACTIITYLGDGSSVTYYKHPADVNDSQTSDILDVADWITYYNETQTPPWGLYSTDVDMSGAMWVLDLANLIDLFNGAGTYADGEDGDPYGAWNGVEWTRDCTPCTGGGDSPAGGGGDSEGDPAGPLAESVVQFMTMSTPGDDEASDFADAALALAGYCVEHLSSAQRQTLADILDHGDTEYASDIACELVPEIVAVLVD